MDNVKSPLTRQESVVLHALYRESRGSRIRARHLARVEACEKRFHRRVALIFLAVTVSFVVLAFATGRVPLLWAILAVVSTAYALRFHRHANFHAVLERDYYRRSVLDDSIDH